MRGIPAFGKADIAFLSVDETRHSRPLMRRKGKAPEAFCPGKAKP
jgi:hypothetical protein